MAVTDDDETKTPLEHTLDVFVYLPLGFMLDFPRSIPRYIERGRRQLEPGRLLGRGGGSRSIDPGHHLGRLQEQTKSTLRALGVVSAESVPSNGQSTSDIDRPERIEMPSQREDMAPGGHTAFGAAILPGANGGIDPAGLAITDYDSLSASQVVPRLDSMGSEELETIRLYEAGTRGRKTILNKIALLQTS